MSLVAEVLDELELELELLVVIDAVSAKSDSVKLLLESPNALRIRFEFL